MGINIRRTMEIKIPVEIRRVVGGTMKDDINEAAKDACREPHKSIYVMSEQEAKQEDRYPEYEDYIPLAGDNEKTHYLVKMAFTMGVDACKGIIKKKVKEAKKNSIQLLNQQWVKEILEVTDGVHSNTCQVRDYSGGKCDCRIGKYRQALKRRVLDEDNK